ncbi:MAG: GNAT family N-acetyltransferase [Thermoleophilia bacterium]|nr:GNAT family N-acetyltransferase [Thermoleophilia bacterium]
MTVRRAEPRDADGVLALLAGLGRPAVADDPLSQREVFAHHLTDPASAIYVAEENGQLAGVASLWFRPRLNWTTREAWVPDLYVDPAHRRRGHARALLDACVAAARDRGCHRLVLESGHDRTEAHGLYEGYGFVHGGRAYGLPLG